MEMIFLLTLMQNVGLVIILAAILLLGQSLIMKGWLKSSAKKGTASHTQAKAIILAVEETGVYMNQQPLVRLQMQVLPEKGRNFITEIKEIMSAPDLANLRSGSTVMVRYNTSNMKEVALVRNAP